MPNPIKYTIGSETDALKKGNFYIGTGSVGKGPSESTGYYQGPSPVSGGYVIYLNRSGAPGDLSYNSVLNDAELISFTNNLAGTSFVSAAQCLVYYSNQTDRICVNIDYPPIITNGLVFNVDAGFSPSYPTSGVTWYDVGGINNGTLINGPTFDSANGGSIVLDGVDDSVSVPINPIFNTPSVTFEVWANLQSRNDRHIVYLNWTGNSLEVNSNRSVSFYNFSTLGQLGTTTTGNVFEFNNWVQFVGMYDNVSQTLQVYVNGVLLATRLNIPSTSYGVNVHSISPSFGRVLGRVSVVRHYNRALTAQEVLQNYNATKSRYGL
jgi:hypothetical protein